MLINIISDVEAAVWLREIDESLNNQFHISREPAHADWHVVYNICREVSVPNDRSRIIFVGVEPPESHYYDPRVLADYRAVVSADFRYLSRSLPNHIVRSGLLPWRIDVSYDNEIPNGLATARDLQQLSPPASDGISIITSSKRMTPLHRQRLRLIDYLNRKIPGLVVLGAGRTEVGSKLEVLQKYRNHIALENSIHSGYWTEKVSDPVLALNRIFYGGHPDVKSDFPGDTVVTIDPWKPEHSYRRIMDSLEQKDYTVLLPELERNRSRVLKELNVMSVLSHLVDELSARPGPSGYNGHSKFSAHRSLGVRTRIARRR